MVAHGPGARPPAARDHVRQPRRGSLDAPSATPTRPRRWPTTPSPCSTRPGSSAPTSTASRSAAWSPSSSRCAIRSGCARSCWARRARRAARRAARPRGHRLLPPSRPTWPQEEALWASVPYQLRPALPRGTPPASRRTSRSGWHTRSATSAYRAQLYAAAWHNCLGALPSIAVPTLVVHGRLDRADPGGQRGADRRAHPGRAAARARAGRAPVSDRAADADEAIARFFADQRKKAA